MLSYHSFQRTSSYKESMMINKIRCQKEKINTQVKVSDQGQLLRVLFHKLRIEEALKRGGETDLL